jgi:anthranilate phosphoribosyltransferase
MSGATVEAIVRRVEGGCHLSMVEMRDTIDGVMAGRFSEDQIARLLLGLNCKGETVAEVAGAAAAMRKHVTPIRSKRTGVIDTCGTGGDGSQTFNISTAAALVVAATGVPVAKHGNRGVTSRSGSADVLAALGVNIEADVPCVQACLDELGICFCFAPLLHPAMKRVAAVRRRLSVPTIFNILGPLANPARAAYQLIGVGRAALRPLLAEALAMLGTDRAVVVHGQDGMDEVSLSGPTDATVVSEGRVLEMQWTPEEFGLPRCSREELTVEGPGQSAAVIRTVLAGRPGPDRDMVVANAAAALWTTGRSPSLPACVGHAAKAIDSGAAALLLERLVECTNRRTSLP